MKLKGLIAGIAFTLFLGMGTVLHEQPVSAAAWHKGTPRFFRGTWHNKYNLWYVYKSKIIVYEGHSKDMGYFNPDPLTHVMYKHYHHMYKFRVWDNAYTTFKWTVISRNKFVLGNGLLVYRAHK